MEKKIIIDLEEIENKNILELKYLIKEQLSKIKVFYSASTPNHPNRTLPYDLHQSFNFEDTKNNEIIKEIKIEEN